jgi:UDP-galactopyranose mutase
MKCDVLIVGAGLAGSILAERIANISNKKVILIDRRNHIGGNCYDHYDDFGMLVHKYGPHIFHTNSKKVWDYLSQFTSWIPYFHRVLGVVEGIKIPIPFNLNSLYKVFPVKYAEKIEAILIDTYGYGINIPILKLMQTDDKDLKFLADYVYKNIFLGYNIKQWGLKPEEIDFSVTSRIPVSISRDDRYFQDIYQGIPEFGYTEIFKKLINHENIELLLNTRFDDIKNKIQYDKLIYTGNIDDYFEFEFGELPYRSLEFDFKNIPDVNFQECAQINYPNNYDFTRITEFKHLTAQKSDSTTIAYEFPKEYIKGINEPYYPIPKKENNDLYQRYINLAEKSAKNVIFAGRLAEYKYYNMDQVTGVALHLFEKHF